MSNPGKQEIDRLGPEQNSTEGQQLGSTSERLLSEATASVTTEGVERQQSPGEQPSAQNKMTALGFPQVEIRLEPISNTTVSAATEGSSRSELSSPRQEPATAGGASVDGPAPPEQGPPPQPRGAVELVAPPRAPGSGGDQTNDTPRPLPTAPEKPESTASGPNST